jgi:hypothetical protein
MADEAAIHTSRTDTKQETLPTRSIGDDTSMTEAPAIAPTSGDAEVLEKKNGLLEGNTTLKSMKEM